MGVTRTPAAGIHSSTLNRRFEAILFDWDGTAVPDRSADATRVRTLVERLCAAGMDLGVVSGTHVGNVDEQLRARPDGPGRLHLLLNRGSEVFRATRGGIELVYRRMATEEEDEALTRAADLTVSQLSDAGLRAEIVSKRLNRRKIDLIPEAAWADPPKAQIDELVVAVGDRLRRAGFRGLPQVVEIAEQAAREAGLPHARVTSDAKHVEIGLTDKSDSARWILADLWRRGVRAGQVLIAGDELGPLGGLPGSDSLMLVREAAAATAVSVGVEPTGVPAGVLALGGGPEAFLDILEDQLRRRKEGEVPGIGEEPVWTITIHGFDPELERVHESLLTIADGRIGTRGSALGDDPAATHSVLASGIYTGGGSATELLPCPLWNRLPLDRIGGSGLRRVLDLRTGLLRREFSSARGSHSALLFSSLARPGVTALRAEGSAELLGPGPTLLPGNGRAGETAEAGETGGAQWMRVDGANGGVAAAAIETRLNNHGSARLDRVAAYVADAVEPPRADEPLRRLREARDAGFERLLAEQREAWSHRWEEADVAVDGDPELQQAIRFALFHLMASVADGGEAGVGARGLSGRAYRGHVFWDSDVFVMPFLAATHSEAARAMLEYRIRRLPAALAAARAIGRTGARFPWESAASGQDVTPTRARDRTGRTVAIRTGLLEEHIVADVAWAAACYMDWTGDEVFIQGPGLRLLAETARYWASRARFDAEGKAHIYGVIGPDEYHEAVDDSAFTNVMARWNLRRAAQAVAAGAEEVSPFERLQWLELADALVDGFDPRTGLYEQFAGFYGLEPLVIADFARRRPVSADLLLGADRLRGAQVVKQADVLMLHHMVPDEVAPGSLLPNLQYYEPRTAHGSSLSPGVHAALFARARLFDAAVKSLHMASRMDLDDLTGTTAGGLHLATMGSVWQALAFGFAGVRPCGEALHVDPALPPTWNGLEVKVRFRGSPVRVKVRFASVRVESDRPIPVVIGEQREPVEIGPSGIDLRFSDGSWEVQAP